MKASRCQPAVRRLVEAPPPKMQTQTHLKNNKTKHHKTKQKQNQHRSSTCSASRTPCTRASPSACSSPRATRWMLLMSVCCVSGVRVERERGGAMMTALRHHPPNSTLNTLNTKQKTATLHTHAPPFLHSFIARTCHRRRRRLTCASPIKLAPCSLWRCARPHAGATKGGPPLCVRVCVCVLGRRAAVAGFAMLAAHTQRK